MKKLIIGLLIAGMLVLYIGCDLGESSDPEEVEVPELVINEFMASNDTAVEDPDEVTNNDPFEDWFEIYNAGDEAVDIGGMYVTDNLDNTMAFQIPTTDAATTTIQPGGFLVIWCDKEMAEGANHVDFALSGSGEAIGLYMSDGVTCIDELTYDAQETDYSYGRVTDGGDEWQVFTTSTPGASNSGGSNTLPVLINEFLASNDASYTDENGEYDDWIEIYNPNSEPFDIGGMYISDDPEELTTWQIPTTHPDSTTIAAGGFLVLFADKQTEQGVLHVNIKLSGDGEAIILTESNGTTVVDSLSFGPQTEDISYGRTPDGGDTWTTFTTPTPGASNN